MVIELPRREHLEVGRHLFANDYCLKLSRKVEICVYLWMRVVAFLREFNLLLFVSTIFRFCGCI